MKNIFDIKTAVISVICGFIITAAAAAGAYAQRVGREISDSVIRFHVLAESDEDYDQKLKLKVRDEILKYLNGDMKNCKSRSDAEMYLKAHTDDINALAEKVIKDEGYDYTVSTTLSEEHYPIRYYGNAVFPEGDYESLRVIIGKGDGHNWWCVMYPPLCLNGEGAEYTDTEILKETLTKDGYDVVVLSSESPAYEMKFKIVEWWASVKN